MKEKEITFCEYGKIKPDTRCLRYGPQILEFNGVRFRLCNQHKRTIECTIGEVMPRPEIHLPAVIVSDSRGKARVRQ